MFNTKTTKTKGFTLAEVLITLGIIGVVAAMTIPTLINMTNHAEYATALKKSYSVFSQAHKQIIADNGDFVSALSNVTDNAGIANVFIQKIKAARVCSGNSECFINPSITYKDLGGNTVDINAFTALDNSSFITIDGMAYWFLGGIDPKCSSSVIQDNSLSPSPLDSTCAMFVVDINGPGKGPATIGRDLFTFYVAKQGIYPSGMDVLPSEADQNCGKTATKTEHFDSAGSSCALIVLKENAMNY